MLRVLSYSNESDDDICVVNSVLNTEGKVCHKIKVEVEVDDYDNQGKSDYIV